MPTYPISAPPITPSSERIALLQNQGIMRSPHSGSTSVVNNYAEWEVTLTFPPQKRSTAAKTYVAWLNSLHGAVGTFTYQPHGSGKAVTGKTLASAGNAYANEILVGGWTAGAATGLEAGDYFTLSGKLHQIETVAANANGSGQATISFSPALRSTIASGTALNFATPTVTLRVHAQDNQPIGSSKMTDADAVYIDDLVAREDIS